MDGQNSVLKKFIIGGAGLLSLGLLGSTLIATVSADLHTALMQQIAQSGLATEQDNHYQSHWLTATHRGQLQLADSYCPGCGAMQYDGKLYHGLASLLDQTLAVASAEYQILWPDLPLEPALPAVNLQAQQGLFSDFSQGPDTEIWLAASQHRITSQRYHLQQQGVQGELKAGQLQLHSPAIEVMRDRQAWFELLQPSLSAIASDQLMLSGTAEQAELPQWQWQGEQLQLHYQQSGRSQGLNADLSLQVEQGRLAETAHQASKARMAVQRLNVPATMAFARELPVLLSDQTRGAARMLGLFSLYSLHGPSFFAPQPALQLQGEDIPLPLGRLDMDISLAISEQTKRPPMHPMEWRQALQGQIKITAPRAHLAQVWQWAANGMNYITGLPGSYQQLLQQQWVKPQSDGRDQLIIIFDPKTGARRA